MATVTGLKGGAAAIGSASGVGRLNALNRKDAGELLARLGNDLNNRTGVVRLLHTSKAEKDMKFQTAGGFKQMFLNGGKLERSGQVIRGLMAQANATPEQLEAFDSYLTQRGRSGVEAERVRQAIEELGLSMPQHTQGSSHDEALAKLGYQINPGARLGAGTYGTVHAFTHRGQAFVVKKPNEENFQSWRLRLEGHAGDPRPVQIESPSAAGADQQQNVRGHHLSDEAPDAEGGSPSPRVSLKFAARQTTEESESDAELDDNDLMVLMMRQGQAWSQDKPGIGNPSSQAAAVQPLQAAPLIGEEAPKEIPSQGGPKPERRNLAVAAMVKSDVPELITPSVYVIRENKANTAEPRYHAVSGGQKLKAWARLQDPSSDFRVETMIMPKAAGKEPLAFGTRTDPKINLKPADLQPLANAGLQALKNMARHGFVHGDIKPENMLWDSESRTLKIIDTDAMYKFSSKPGSSGVNGSVAQGTPFYAHPLQGATNQPLGAGRDLFALGMSLLECSVYARGDKTEIEQLGHFDEWKRQGGLITLKTNGNMNKRIDALGDPNNPVERVARLAMREAVAYEVRRANGNGVGDGNRWTADDNNHPLNVVSRELEKLQT